ncbi:flagellin [Paracoccus sp. SCSIO 75233]|uniref:flagellin n=1 Tax=Paracoccus sp. SCSIO 75233 TaxID=3017782 RepID=UPI0022F029FA|nr:flagellin [Paracoccus sp. SCSIO 75233]WBU52948.1 flagellin [Paracoccus sp. SCSIO 75233]
MSMRSANASLRGEVKRLSNEVATGRATDTARHLGGNLFALSEIERGIREATIFQQVATEAGTRASAMQSSLGRLQDISGEMSTKMLAADTLLSAEGQHILARNASGGLRAAIGALNAEVAGQFPFSGTKVNIPPVVSAEKLLSQAEQVISGAGTAEEAVQVLRSWFSRSQGDGGFVDHAYQGSVDAQAAFRVGPATEVRFAQTAADPAVREVLFGLTLGALVSRGAFSGSHGDQTRLLQAGGEALLTGHSKVGGLRADLGETQQSIEQASVRLKAMQTTLKIQRTDLVGRDSYEAGSQLVQAEAQLAAVYAMTARLSQLSLARYL